MGEKNSELFFNLYWRNWETEQPKVNQKSPKRHHKNRQIKKKRIDRFPLFFHWNFQIWHAFYLGTRGLCQTSWPEINSSDFWGQVLNSSKENLRGNNNAIIGGKALRITFAHLLLMRMISTNRAKINVNNNLFLSGEVDMRCWFFYSLLEVITYIEIWRISKCDTMIQTIFLLDQVRILFINS